MPASKEPVDSLSSLNSFSRYYNIKFGQLNCVAYADACTEIGASSFPSLVLFKDGEEVKRSVGDKDMDKLKAFIEDALESIRPGSRPKGGLELPEVGSKGFGSGSDSNATDKKEPSKTKPKGKSKAKGEGSSEIVKAPIEPSGAPNHGGASQVLTLSNFTEVVTNTLNPWFIKFYAPWCHHCQALAPNWAAMARDMEGRLNIGEVDCVQEKKLCKDMKVRAFPTMALFRGPERIEYEGLRGLGDLKSFAERAVGAVNEVPDVTATQFDELEKKDEAVFVYFYDHATTSEDFMALERLPLHILGHAKLVKTKDKDLNTRFKISTWPRLMVSRSGKASIYPELMPQHMRDVPNLVKWMQDNWLPLVPELTAANSHDIMDGKFAVLGILSNERHEGYEVAKREIKSAAIEWIERQTQAFELEREELRDTKKLRIEEAEDRKDQRAVRDAKLIKINMDEIKRKEVSFSWVDGVFWERWIRATFDIDVKEGGERVIIYDLDVSAPRSAAITRSLTAIAPEPPLLGQHHHRQRHRPLTHLDTGDAAQSRRLAAEADAQEHRIHHLPPPVQGQSCIHTPPARLFGRHGRPAHRPLHRQESGEEEKIVRREQRGLLQHGRQGGAAGDDAAEREGRLNDAFYGNMSARSLGRWPGGAPTG